MKMFFYLFLLLPNSIFATDEIDPNGYIAFCPCMGRFGNQADQFLGALGFAKGVNRTLILPPWVEYSPGIAKSIQVPFDNYFKVEPLRKFHRVITMENFMKNLAPVVWPESERIALCYMARHDSNNSCNAKEGNPFGPFWDTFQVEFVGSSFYGNLTYDVHHQSMGEKWRKRYPAQKWKVLAFTGAPATFPVQMENKSLQKYLQWSDIKVGEAKREISRLPRGPFIAIHLRNGIDWERACKHVEWSPALFAGPQCLGYRNEHGKATMDLCLPSDETILKQLKRILRTMKGKSVFVASDSDHKIDLLSEGLRKMEVSVHRMEKANPHIELAVMGLANHFIGNCISSFSAFAKRERDTKGFPSSFWAFPIKQNKPRLHTEL